MARTVQRAVLLYLAVIGLLFLGTYAVLGIREMALYLVLMLGNLPASIALVPYMESVAQSLGWPLGGPLHVSTTQLACMAANAIFVAAVAVVGIHLWRLVRGHSRAL